MSNQFPLYCVIRDHNSVVDQVTHQYEFSDLKKIQNKLFKSLNIDLESLRNDIIKLARKTLDGKFNYIFNDLEEFNDSIDNLHNQWVFFTDNDDWCYPYFHNHIQSKLFTIDNSVDAIIWSHIRLDFGLNHYACTLPCYLLRKAEYLVQTNNSVICLNDNFFNFEILADWETNIFDRFQHWYQSDFYNSKTDAKIVTFDDTISAWNKNITSMTILKDHIRDGDFLLSETDFVNLMKENLSTDFPLLHNSLKFDDPNDKRNLVEYKDWRNSNEIHCVNQKDYLLFYDDLINEQKEIYKFYFKHLLKDEN